VKVAGCGGWLRADHFATSAGVIAGGDLPVTGPPRKRLVDRVATSVCNAVGRVAAALGTPSVPTEFRDDDDFDVDDLPDGELEELESTG